MSDLINRQAALDTIFSEPLYKSGMKKRDADVVVPVIYEKIKSLPSAQPTLYGYPVEHLVFVANVLHKEGIEPDELANVLEDTGYAVKLVIESLQDALHKVKLTQVADAERRTDEADNRKE